MQSGQNPVLSTNPDNFPGSSASPNDQNSLIIPYVNISLHEKFRKKKRRGLTETKCPIARGIEDKSSHTV